VRFIPDWMAGFKREAKRFRKTMEAARDEPYAMVKDQVVGQILKTEFIT
jgi:hypothetical protein